MRTIGEPELHNKNRVVQGFSNQFLQDIEIIICGRGGTGRRKGLKIPSVKMHLFEISPQSSFRSAQRTPESRWKQMQTGYFCTTFLRVWTASHISKKALSPHSLIAMLTQVQTIRGSR
jgi:hypothetical protein